MGSTHFSLLLTQLSAQQPAVLDERIPRSAYIPVNISASNPDLASFDISSSKEWELYIQRYLKSHNKQVAYGGYLEKRDIYKRSARFNQNKAKTERNIHLGVDFWTKEGTTVIAPFDGTIHSYQNNIGYGNYGPTIIMKHYINSYSFYTLYGHLSLTSINNLEVNQKIQRGEPIGQLGSSHENGDYAPHLHFQIIQNIEDYYGDYPGVVAQDDLNYYQDNCPNPLALLGL